MIKKSEIKRIKKILGKNYATKILDFFSLKNYTRESGSPYTKQDIWNFFWGRYDLTLHIKIVEAAEHYKEQLELLKKKQESLLQKEKPEGATPGQ